MKRVTAVIIGGGQCGLAMSRELSAQAIDHLVLERGRACNSWRHERWDSLRLLSPNWMNGLPGLEYEGGDREGFMHVSQFADLFDTCIERNAFPLMTETQVLEVVNFGAGYRVQTNRGAIACRFVIIATGACAIPKIPSFADGVPAHVRQVSPLDYKRPGDLPEGHVLVVGASASGLQLARELQLSGRQVTLAVGNHLRLPRRYRGADIMTWMHLIQAFDVPYDQVDDIERARRLPSLALMGHRRALDLDLNSLQDIGVQVVGRLAAISDGTAWFSGSLANSCTSADLKLNRLLDRIDEWAGEAGFDEVAHPPRRPEKTRIDPSPALRRDLSRGSVGSIVWATGFRPDHSWLKLPVFDRKGRIQHDGGVVGDGLYVMGLPYLRTARSVHIDGAQRDARVLSRHISGRLSIPIAA